VGHGECGAFCGRRGSVGIAVAELVSAYPLAGGVYQINSARAAARAPGTVAEPASPGMGLAAEVVTDTTRDRNEM
jgi:hypothetical protein